MYVYVKLLYVVYGIRVTHFLVHAALVAHKQVGKTSLMKRYAAGDFTDYRRPTIGADFMTKEVVEGDQPMLLQVCTAAVVRPLKKTP